MRTTFRLFAGLAVCATLLLRPSSAHAQRLTGAEFYSQTKGDDKDHDTGVWVKVVTSDEKTKLAHISNADNSSGDKTHYNDNTNHTIKLKIDDGHATYEQCKKFRFKVGTKANGNDDWKFSGRVTLYFEDGKRKLIEHAANTSLNSRGSTYVEFPKWEGGK
jgi:hypothetical protein